MVGFSGVAIIVLLGIAHNVFQDKVREGRSDKIREFGYSIQNEIILASEVHEGYKRNVTLPSTLGETGYGVKIQNNFLVINYTEGEVLFPLPEVSGSISKGTNTIKNVDGNVQIS